jgi:pimeloyl-ACP methyl ester carboxylesterase
VAIALASRHPGLVSRIVAFAPPLYPNSAAARRQLAKTDPLAKLFLTHQALSHRLCDLRTRYVKTSTFVVRLANPALPGQLAEDRVRHSWQSYSQTLANLIVSAKLSEVLTDLDIPVRLVVGQRDKALDLPFLAGLSTGCSHLSLSIIGDAGHDLPLSHPALCIAELEAAAQVSHQIPPSASAVMRWRDDA